MRRKLAALTVLILLTAACIHKTGAPVTPMERASTYNAAMSEGNNAITQGVIAANSQALITAEQAKPILTWCSNTATIHEQITATLRQSSTVTAGTVATIAGLVDQIKASAQAIPPEALGLKNPNSKQLFKLDVANVYALADAILNALQAGGVK